ncbi:MAG: hypothetical protein COC24_006645 [Alphaproteobacteria bacterium]|nr:hypothetical protein [Alphaproteobacteria bacterium]
MKKIIIASALFLSMSTVAFAGSPTWVDTGLGNVVADDKGMTVYTFKKDKKGTSNCYDDCATAWPPFYAGSYDDAKGDFSKIERKDGKMQWAHKGWPLYLWQGDAAKGDTTGNKVGGVWFVVKK